LFSEIKALTNYFESPAHAGLSKKVTTKWVEVNGLVVKNICQGKDVPGGSLM
jgi:hypothetical protein